jgi:predicted nucleotidyltransferase
MYFDTDPDWLDRIRDWALGYPAVRRVCMYGSRVTGRRRVKSSAPATPDLDLAVELAPDDMTVSTYVLAQHRAMLEDLQARLQPR